MQQKWQQAYLETRLQKGSFIQDLGQGAIGRTVRLGLKLVLDLLYERVAGVDLQNALALHVRLPLSIPQCLQGEGGVWGQVMEGVTRLTCCDAVLSVSLNLVLGKERDLFSEAVQHDQLLEERLGSSELLDGIGHIDRGGRWAGTGRVVG